MRGFKTWDVATPLLCTRGFHYERTKEQSSLSAGLKILFPFLLTSIFLAAKWDDCTSFSH